MNLHLKVLVESELLFSQVVEEEEEGWAFVGLFLLVRECNSSFHVVRGASVELELCVLADHKFDELSASFLEFINAISLAASSQLISDCLEEVLDICHEVSFGQLNLV